MRARFAKSDQNDKTDSRGPCFNCHSPKLPSVAMKLTREVKHEVRTVSRKINSIRGVTKKMHELGFCISKSSVSNILDDTTNKNPSTAEDGQTNKFRRVRRSRTNELIRKVKVEVRKENPKTQRVIASRYGTNATIVNRIIHEDLCHCKRTKSKVHRLTESHKKNRKRNCRQLYEGYLAGQKCEYVVTLDEAYFYLVDCDRPRDICYVKQGEKAPDKWLHECKEKFPHGFMVVAAICGRGVLPLIRVPPTYVR